MSNQQKNDLMLDVGQANEFKLACRKAGLTNADVKALSSVGMLSRLLPVLRGCATTKRIEPFSVWKKVFVPIGACTAHRLSNCFPKEDLPGELFILSNDVMELLRKHVILTNYEQDMFNIVLITGYDLGFGEEVSCDDILRMARSFGLKTLTWSDALYVRLQHKGIVGEEIYVGMQPIFVSDPRYETILKLVNEDGNYMMQDEHITRSICKTGHICKSTFHPAEKWIFIQVSE